MANVFQPLVEIAKDVLREDLPMELISSLRNPENLARAANRKHQKLRPKDPTTSVRFLRRPVGPRPATLLSGLQLQKRVGPVGRQLLYLLCWAEWSTTVIGYLRNKILFKRYTFSYDPTPATDVYPHNSRCQNCISLSHKGNIIFDIIILPICSCIRVT